MEIVVFGAAGNIGQRIVKEALSRGHKVTAVVRDPAKLSLSDPGLKVVQGNAANSASVAQVSRGSEVVISAIGPNWQEGNIQVLVEAAHALRAGLKEARVKRLLVVGGAGSLEAAPGVQRLDMPDFPAEWKPLAIAHRDALQIYRGEKNLDWTYLSPADLITPGARTGRYRTGTEQLVRDANGKSAISMEDYAVALLDEVEHPKHIKQRFTVAY